jgi:hypothetical protein
MVGCTKPTTAALNTVTLQVDKGLKEKLQFLIEAGAQLSSCKYASIREGSVYDPRTVVNIRGIPCCTGRVCGETEMGLSSKYYETTHTFI